MIKDRVLTCLQTSSFGAFLSASIIEYGFFRRSSATFCQYFAVVGMQTKQHISYVSRSEIDKEIYLVKHQKHNKNLLI